MSARHFRAHQRFPVRLHVTVTSLGRPVLSQGRTVDLGIGGSALELDTPLRLGERVQVRIDDTYPITIPGEVAWVAWSEASAVRLGVRFRMEDASPLSSVLEALGVTADFGT
jgi:hypothetical protein